MPLGTGYRRKSYTYQQNRPRPPLASQWNQFGGTMQRPARAPLAPGTPQQTLASTMPGPFGPMMAQLPSMAVGSVRYPTGLFGEPETFPNTATPSMPNQNIYNHAQRFGLPLPNAYEMGLRERQQQMQDGGTLGSPTPTPSSQQLIEMGASPYEVMLRERMMNRTPPSQIPQAPLGQPGVETRPISNLDAYGVPRSPSGAVVGYGSPGMERGYTTASPRINARMQGPYQEGGFAAGLRLQGRDALLGNYGLPAANEESPLLAPQLPAASITGRPAPQIVNSMTPYPGQHLGLPVSEREGPGPTPVLPTPLSPEVQARYGTPGTPEWQSLTSDQRARLRMQQPTPGGEFVARRGYDLPHVSEDEMRRRREESRRRRQESRPRPGFPRLPSRLSEGERTASVNQRRRAFGLPVTEGRESSAFNPSRPVDRPLSERQASLERSIVHPSVGTALGDTDPFEASVADVVTGFSTSRGNFSEQDAQAYREYVQDRYAADDQFRKEMDAWLAVDSKWADPNDPEQLALLDAADEVRKWFGRPPLERGFLDPIGTSGGF